MQETPQQSKLRKIKNFLNVVSVGLGLFALGSCVVRIDDVGGGVNSTQEAAGIFFFYAIIVFPVLAGVKVYIELKIEKMFANPRDVSRQEAASDRVDQERKDGESLSLASRLFKKPWDEE